LKVYTEKILIVDSEATVRQVLKKRLTYLGYTICLASNGNEALSLFNKEHPNIVVLDIMLPKLDGYEVCRKIRENSQIPIIILTALNEISEKVRGFELGADDYIIKPFSLKELETRIYSLLRRTNLRSPTKTHKRQNNLQYANLVLNTTTKQASKNGIKIKLTKIEFSLLELLIENAGNVLSRHTIMDNIWGYTPERFIDARIVDVNIARLRSKVEENPNRPDLIRTIRGNGYLVQN